MSDTPPGAILGQLDPIMGAITEWGWDLARASIEHRYLVGAAVTVFIAAVAIAARAGGRDAGLVKRDASGASRVPNPASRAGRIGWVAGALAAATWGQVLLFSDAVVAGAALYGVAVAAAIVFGAAHPLREGVPPLRRFDVAAAAALTVLALVVRLYAIDELPAFVDIEPVLAFFESLSPYGLAHYVAENRVQDDGFVHMLARAAVQQVTGPSVVGIRLTAVLCGTLAVPLCYAFVRRLTGPFCAALAALLLLTAPDQLIFSRIEATHFALVPSAALITAHLTLWLVRGWSAAAAMATALWMPLSRYFYAAAIVLFLLPIATVVHALLCGPRRRPAAGALPIVLGGALLWLGASPALRYAATGTWGESTSLEVYGSAFFLPFNVEDRAGAPSGVLPALRFQLARFADNSGQLLRQFGYDRHAYSAWYLRDHPDERHRRSLHAALLVPFAVGIGYLLGRWRDGRAALVLLWVFLGVLPAVMSDDVEPRRLVVFFPAVPVVVAVVLDAVARAVRGGAPRLGGWPLGAVLAGAAACVAVTSLAAHYRVHRAPLQYTEYVACTQPYFETSDGIFHNVGDVNTIGILAFGNAAAFRRRLPGLHFVRDWDVEWEQVTGAIGCPFDHPIFRTLLPESALQDRCAAFRPARITYLLRVETADEQALAARLRRRFPDAVERDCRGHDRDDPIRHLVGLTVTRDT